LKIVISSGAGRQEDRKTELSFREVKLFKEILFKETECHCFPIWSIFSFSFIQLRLRKQRKRSQQKNRMKYGWK